MTFLTAAGITTLGLVFAATGRGPTAAAMLTLAAGYSVLAYCYRA
jgi:hypothetical protein